MGCWTLFSEQLEFGNGNNLQISYGALNILIRKLSFCRSWFILIIIRHTFWLGNFCLRTIFNYDKIYPEIRTFFFFWKHLDLNSQSTSVSILFCESTDSYFALFWEFHFNLWFFPKMKSMYRMYISYTFEIQLVEKSTTKNPIAWLNCFLNIEIAMQF